jgi:hypothetical protein
MDNVVPNAVTSTAATYDNSPVQPLSYSAPSGNMLGTSILGKSLTANDYNPIYEPA